MLSASARRVHRISAVSTRGLSRRWLSTSSTAAVSSTAAAASKINYDNYIRPAAGKRFAPDAIYPTAVGSVRVCNNTIRDAQQSNLSAEMAAAHRLQVATMIDDCYSTTKGPPGVEQIFGGTITMFDLWKRGVHPFDHLRAVKAYLPNTATSMLVRSNSLNSMNSQPRDVVDAFIKHCYDAGIDVCK